MAVAEWLRRLDCDPATRVRFSPATHLSHRAAGERKHSQRSSRVREQPQTLWDVVQWKNVGLWNPMSMVRVHPSQPLAGSSTGRALRSERRGSKFDPSPVSHFAGVVQWIRTERYERSDRGSSPCIRTRFTARRAGDRTRPSEGRDRRSSRRGWTTVRGCGSSVM